ncbi:MAG: anion permease [Alphaproteobacteria bacterium]|nr:anion permease [Alphaproteobacteria bacterium]
MSLIFLFYLSSGLFLGWASGANYMGNVFGTAVGTKMLSFTAAALICSIFIIFGAVYGGAGAASTIGSLGSINTMAGAFVAALAAAFAIFMITKTGLPVSSTQAIVGGIIGWNAFVGMPIDTSSLFKILGSWVVSPVLAAIFAMILMRLVKAFLHRFPLPLLYQDLYVRIALILTGAFGAYSLGANNIGNIVGVFTTAAPFNDVDVMGIFTLSSTQQLFLLGGIAIAAGVFTYSRKVINTIGREIMELSPTAAWVVVMSHSLVMFLFASENLHDFLVSHGLPAIPLVPISSSEAVIGAVVGIAFLQRGRGLRLKSLGKVAAGWITCPFIAALFSFIAMFFMQNLFGQPVH